MSISINVVIDDKEPSMTLTIDDGSGDIKSVVIPVQLESKKKKTAAQKPNESAINRPLMDQVFTRYLTTGDITEIRDIPDHKTIFKNYMFCTITDLKNRTVHLEKASTRRLAFGVMPAQYWDDGLIDGLEATLKDGPQRAVIFTDGSRPMVISDIAFLDERDWNTLGRLFNSLYSKF